MTKKRSSKSEVEEYYGPIMIPKVDYAFRLIFGDEGNKDILLNFLASCLKINKKTISHVECLNLEINDCKQSVLDVLIKLNNNDQLYIIIQINYIQDKNDQPLLYWSKMYSQLLEKSNFKNKFSKCIELNIVDYEFLDTNKEYHSTFHLVEKTLGIKMTDEMEVHFFELPKVSKYYEIKDKDKELTYWMQFLNAKDNWEMDMLLTKNKNVGRAVEAMRTICEDERKLRGYESREMKLLDQRSFLDEIEEQYKIGYKIGFDIGFEKAKKEAIEKAVKGQKIELALKMLKKGIEIELISKLTKLTIEEINEIEIKLNIDESKQKTEGKTRTRKKK